MEKPKAMKSQKHLNRDTIFVQNPTVGPESQIQKNLKAVKNPDFAIEYILTVFWMVSKLADHLNVIFYSSDIIYMYRKDGNLCRRPPSNRLGVPFP